MDTRVIQFPYILNRAQCTFGVFMSNESYRPIEFVEDVLGTIAFCACILGIFFI